MTSFRVRRVQSMLMREISGIISAEIKDPRVAGVIVTGVEATGDLKRAVVYYRLLNNDAHFMKDAEAGLKSATGVMKRMLSDRMRMKFMPELDFRYDPTLDNAGRIEAILKEVAKEEGRENE